MMRQYIINLYTAIVIVSTIVVCAEYISDLRQCATEDCDTIISEAHAIQDYDGSQHGTEFLSFTSGAKIEITSQSAGKRPDLWGGRLGERFGYFPKSFVKETKILIHNPNHPVSTGAKKPTEHVADGAKQDESSRTDKEPESGEPRGDPPNDPAVHIQPTESKEALSQTPPDGRRLSSRDRASVGGKVVESTNAKVSGSSSSPDSKEKEITQKSSSRRSSRSGASQNDEGSKAEESETSSSKPRGDSTGRSRRSEEKVEPKNTRGNADDVSGTKRQSRESSRARTVSTGKVMESSQGTNDVPTSSDAKKHSSRSSRSSRRETTDSGNESTKQDTTTSARGRRTEPATESKRAGVEGQGSHTDSKRSTRVSDSGKVQETKTEGKSAPDDSSGKRSSKDAHASKPQNSEDTTTSAASKRRESRSESSESDKSTGGRRTSSASQPKAETSSKNNKSIDGAEPETSSRESRRSSRSEKSSGNESESATKESTRSTSRRSSTETRPSSDGPSTEAPPTTKGSSSSRSERASSRRSVAPPEERPNPRETVESGAETKSAGSSARSGSSRRAAVVAETEKSPSTPEPQPKVDEKPRRRSSRDSVREEAPKRSTETTRSTRSSKVEEEAPQQVGEPREESSRTRRRSSEDVGKRTESENVRKDDNKSSADDTKTSRQSSRAGKVAEKQEPAFPEGSVSGEEPRHKKLSSREKLRLAEENAKKAANQHPPDDVGKVETPSPNAYSIKTRTPRPEASVSDSRDTKMKKVSSAKSTSEGPDIPEPDETDKMNTIIDPGRLRDPSSEEQIQATRTLTAGSDFLDVVGVTSSTSHWQMPEKTEEYDVIVGTATQDHDVAMSRMREKFMRRRKASIALDQSNSGTNGADQLASESVVTSSVNGRATDDLPRNGIPPDSTPHPDGMPNPGSKITHTKPVDGTPTLTSDVIPSPTDASDSTPLPPDNNTPPGGATSEDAKVGEDEKSESETDSDQKKRIGDAQKQDEKPVKIEETEFAKNVSNISSPTIQEVAVDEASEAESGLPLVYNPESTPSEIPASPGRPDSTTQGEFSGKHRSLRREAATESVDPPEVIEDFPDIELPDELDMDESLDPTEEEMLHNIFDDGINGSTGIQDDEGKINVNRVPPSDGKDSMEKVRRWEQISEKLHNELNARDSWTKKQKAAIELSEFLELSVKRLANQAIVQNETKKKEADVRILKERERKQKEEEEVLRIRAEEEERAKKEIQKREENRKKKEEFERLRLKEEGKRKRKKELRKLAEEERKKREKTEVKKRKEEKELKKQKEDELKKQKEEELKKQEEVELKRRREEEEFQKAAEREEELERKRLQDKEEKMKKVQEEKRKTAEKWRRQSEERRKLEEEATLAEETEEKTKAADLAEKADVKMSESVSSNLPSFVQQPELHAQTPNHLSRKVLEHGHLGPDSANVSPGHLSGQSVQPDQDSSGEKAAEPTGKTHSVYGMPNMAFNIPEQKGYQPNPAIAGDQSNVAGGDRPSESVDQPKIGEQVVDGRPHLEMEVIQHQVEDSKPETPPSVPGGDAVKPETSIPPPETDVAKPEADIAPPEPNVTPPEAETTEEGTTPSTEESADVPAPEAVQPGPDGAPLSGGSSTSPNTYQSLPLYDQGLPDQSLPGQSLPDQTPVQDLRDQTQVQDLPDQTQVQDQPKKPAGPIASLLEPLTNNVIQALPKDIQAFLEQEPIGLPPTYTVLVLLVAAVSSLLASCCCLMGGSKEDAFAKKLMARCDRLDKELMMAVHEKETLEETLYSLEGKTKTAETHKTKTDTEYNKLKKDLQTSQLHTKALKKDLDSLEEKAKTLEEVYRETKDLVQKKDNELIMMRTQLTQIENYSTEITSQLTQVQALLEGKEWAVQQLEGQMTGLNEEVNLLTQSKQQLLSRTIDHDEKVKELGETNEKLERENNEIRDMMSFKDNEIEVLKDCMMQLKVIENEASKSSESDNDSTSGGDSAKKSSEERINDMMNVSRMRAILTQLEEDKVSLQQKLIVEIEDRKDMEDQFKKSQQQIENLKTDTAKANRECQEALTKLTVLTSYFKEKELEMQKAMGSQLVMSEMSRAELDQVGSKTKELQREVDMYKEQVEDLKKEISNVERDYKTQLAANEKKAHENWLAARAAERELKESKLEMSQLRQKMNEMERQRELVGPEGLIRPLPTRAAPFMNGPPGPHPLPPMHPGTPERPNSRPSPHMREMHQSPPLFDGLPPPPPHPMDRRPPLMLPGPPPPFMERRMMDPPYDRRGPPERTPPPGDRRPSSEGPPYDRHTPPDRRYQDSRRTPPYRGDRPPPMRGPPPPPHHRGPPPPHHRMGPSPDHNTRDKIDAPSPRKV